MAARAQVGGPGLAVIDDPDRGPKFGAEGLTINLDASRGAAQIQSRLGTFYQNMPAGSRSFFPEGRSTDLKNLQVSLLS